MSHTRFRLLAVVLTLVLALSFSASAFAADATAWERVEITLHDDPAGGVLLVTGQLPETAKLPAQVALAAPTGTTLQWAGELLGGPAENDPTVEPKVTRVGDMDVYSFTLTKSRMGQVEVVVPDAYTSGATGTAAVVKYTATADTPEIAVSVRVPSGAQIKEPLTGAELVQGPQGAGYYQRVSNKVKVGDDLGMAFAFAGGVAPGAGAVAPATSGSSNSWIYVVLIGLFAIAAFAVFMAVRRQIPAEVEYEEDDEDLETAPGMASKESAEDADESLEADEADEAPAPKSKLRPAITFGIIALFVVMAIVVVNITSKPTVEGGVVTKVFAGGDPCVTATIPLTIAAAKDPGQAANSVLVALESAGPLKSATVDIDKSTVLVGFCESENTEQAIRAAIASTGLLAEGSAAPAPSTDGSAPAQ